MNDQHASTCKSDGLYVSNNHYASIVTVDLCEQNVYRTGEV